MSSPSFSPNHIFYKQSSGDGKPDSSNSKANSPLSGKENNNRTINEDLSISGNEYFINYELSWLKFNWRVLFEAKNKNVPLLERVKFIGIVCSNLDEFFQKRVGGLKRQFHAGVTDLSIDGKTPKEQLTAIRKDVGKMIREYRDCYFNELIPALREQQIIIETYENISDSMRSTADDYFENQLYPIITPLAVDEAHPFPFISNKSRSLAVKLRHPNSSEDHFARIKIPANRPRWIQLKSTRKKVILLSVDDLVANKINRFFPGMSVLSANIFRVTRNADIERNEEEADDLLEMIEDELRERRFAEVVRLEIDKDTPDDVKSYLLSHLGVSKHDVYEMEGPIGLADAVQLYDLEHFSELKFSKWTPTLHPVFKHEIDQETPNIFSVIKNGDFIVHHPYHSFESSTQHFIEQAADDPKVLAIKQTLYRTSSDSPLMHALIRAADDGKQVAVLIELKARFDEERNITWAQRLEKAGVHVSYGFPGLKIHSKMTIVVREEEDGLNRYVHIGTGNYHPDTAQLYEDLGYFTSRKEIASDITDVFNLLTGYAPDQSFKKMLVAPNNMRIPLIDLIDKEIEQAKKGEKAQIIGKMNNLEDSHIIQKLYQASEAGVSVDLIVRSVCKLIPGKKGLSENIRVHAIIGRFLEHSRCYYFHNGGNDLYYIGSADWMHRNLDARIEALAPIEQPSLKKYLQFLLNTILNDNQQRWILGPTGEYKKVKPGKGEHKLSVHEQLMSHAKNMEQPIPAP